MEPRQRWDVCARNPLGAPRSGAQDFDERNLKLSLPSVPCHSLSQLCARAGAVERSCTVLSRSVTGK